MPLLLPLAAIALGVASASSVPLPCRTPTLGVEVTNISYSMRRSRNIPDYVAGAMVRVVRMKSPAARAGVATGDVIQAVGEDLIQNVCGFRAAMSKHGCEQVRLNIRRGNDTMAIDVLLAEEKPRPPGKLDDAGACQNGDGAACTALAKSHHEAADLLQLACDLGEGEGCYLMAFKMANDKRAVAAYEQACDDGTSKGCTNLGLMYERGTGVPVDLEAAIRLFQRGCKGSACTGPNNVGCVNIGRAYRDGRGVTKDQSRATRIFLDVCDRQPAPHDADEAQSIARACSLAGTAYLLGDGVGPDIKKALTLLEKGCAADDTSFGCYNLGTIYENGKGVERDKSRAVTYYKRACEHEDKEACEEMTALQKKE